MCEEVLARGVADASRVLTAIFCWSQEIVALKAVKWIVRNRRSNGSIAASFPRAIIV